MAAKFPLQDPPRDFEFEGSSHPVRITFLDPDGNQEAPASASYIVYDRATGNEIQESTAISPIAAQVDVIIPAATQALLAETNPEEIRRMEVVALFGSVTLVQVYDYRVINAKSQ